MEKEDKSLEGYVKNSPVYHVNLDGLIRSAEKGGRRLYVEGESDRKAYQILFGPRCGWKITELNGKKNVVEAFELTQKMYKKNENFFFCVDVDYELILEHLRNSTASELIQEENFFYQFSSLKLNEGYNDLESLLVNDFTAFFNMMSSYYKDEEYIEIIHSKVLELGIFIGAYRIADKWVCLENGLKNFSLLCNKGNRDVFGIDYLNDFGLLDLEKMEVEKKAFIDNLILCFSDAPHGDLLPSLLNRADEILKRVGKDEIAKEHLLRGHDLTRIIAYKLQTDKMKVGENIADVHNSVEEKLRIQIGLCKDTIKKFPIGRILK